MYIHFYTIASGLDTLDIYWYCNDTENIELFSDLKYFLNKMKSYGKYTTYTGDIFVVKNIHKFKEILILVGTEDSSTTLWSLQDNKFLSINTCKVTQASKFYELFDTCFEDYEIINSFSSEASLSKNRIEIDDFTTTKILDDGGLILVQFNGHKYPMPYYKFNILCYSTIQTRLDNNILSNWFNSLITKNEYLTAFNTIHKLINYNEKEEDTTGAQEEEKDDATVMTEQESAKISKDEWITLFCQLYLDDSFKKSDLNDSEHKFASAPIPGTSNESELLSDIYQMYLTASEWTKTGTVSMKNFIKHLRKMNKFTIKRRAKGMMVIGVSCLVNLQEDLLSSVKQGKCYKRQLLHYKSPVEINSILTKYKDNIERIGLKYTREAFILLNDSNIKLDYQTVAQFVSIPQISIQLKPYSEYIESVLKNNISETEINGKRVKKFNIEFENNIVPFRDINTRCILYFPFANAKNNSRSILKNDPATVPIAFNENNEEFGMFLSSKEYYAFEPEKNTRDCNNSMDMLLASQLNDTSNWRKGSRIVAQDSRIVPQCIN